MNEYSQNEATSELVLIEELNEPIEIQNYLDSIDYNTKEDTKSPRRVVIEESAHCFEGALFAAAYLRKIGYPPLIVDLRAVNDDDHVIAVYQENNCWGSIAKSNFTTLRFREPVYRSLRELVMSYFDFYFNTLGEKTLREYSSPFNLSRFDNKNWVTTDEDLEYIGEFLEKSKHYKLFDPSLAIELSKVSPSLLEAGLLGSNSEGLFIPK